MADHRLHALVPGFADVADDDQRGRPEYPSAFVPAMCAHAGIAAAVADAWVTMRRV